MNILAIPATNSRNGINKQLLTYVSQLLTEQGKSVEILDLNEYEMAIYSPDREAEGVPAEAQAFYDKIGAADAVIVSFAEYNGSFTPAWKNTYDWASRIDAQVYQGKPVLMLAASPGPRAGAGVLGAATMSAPFFGAELIGSIGIGTFYETFDREAGALIDVELGGELKKLLATLSSTVHSD